VVEDTPEAPNIVSTAVTETAINQFYVYDVNADGNPTPTYSLPVSPTGMSIDPSSGLIEWTPTMTGAYDVTVQATNSEGFDTQAFTIQVTDQLICPADITAFWPLDETSGSIYDDFYNGHDATCTGTGETCPTSTSSGQINGAQDFNGSNTRLNVPAHADFNWGQSDSFSIELWMKGISGQTCSGSSQVMIGRDDDSGGSGLQWWLGCNSTGKAAFQLHAASGANAATLTSPAVINDGGWHHLVAIRDGVNNTNYLYIDGSEVASTSHTYTGGFASAGQPLNIGWFDHSSSGPSFHFRGAIDEVATYNRALSVTEIEHRHERGLDKLALCTGPTISIAKRSKVASRSLVASKRPVYVPLAIISAMVRRSSSVMPGSAAGG
jgi:hypothetical protein